MKKESAKKLFQQLDTNGDGYLTFQEFSEMIIDHFGIIGNCPREDELINDLFTLADGNGAFNMKDEKLNFSEFFKVVSVFPEHFTTVKEALCKVIFRMIDTDNDGFLSQRELTSFLKKIGVDFTQEEIKALITRIDIDKNEKIDFEEFFSLYRDDRLSF